MATDQILQGVAIFIFGTIAYLFPTYLGWNKRNRAAIATLNVLLGWTIIGWVVALIWALTQTESSSGPTRTCPLCAETVKAAARKCRFCGADLPPAIPV
jgi:hypothetical protein